MSSSGEALEPSLTYLRPEVLKLKQRLDDFINDEVIPAETEYHDHMKDRHSMNERWSIDAIPSCFGRLQSRAKDIGLWNIFLPPRLLKFPHWDTTILGNELRPSIDDGLTYREYGILAESTGKSILGSMACNCSAPDTGNMEVLLEFGTSYQKKHYLKPLLEGKIRSTFLMTEPDVASSDPTNLETVLLIKKHKQQSSGGGGGGGDRSGDTTYTLNGTKWWSTGAMDPRCRIGICVAKIVDDDDDDDDNDDTDTNTDTNNNSTDNLHGKHTIVMIPLPHPNVIMIRPLTVFGYDDAPFGHSEVGLENVPLQKEHLIGGLGSGFKVSQARLGPGRIHHCMRSIGLAQRCYDLMLNRSTERKTFGKYLFQHGSVQNDIAESFNDLNQARLLTLHCAHMMDTSPNGPRGARQYISGIKVAVPALCFRVIDRALQVHGGLGVCEDTILASAWANMRTLRIADGPDEVHRRSVARIEIKKLFLEKTSSSQQQQQQKHKSRL